MKKIIFLTFLSLSGRSAFAQNENYFSKIDLTASLTKDFASQKTIDLDLKLHGVYGWFFYQFRRDQPFKRQFTEKITLLTIGYGQLRRISNNSNLAAGIGLTGISIPEYGTVPKTSKLYWGGSLYGNLSSLRSAFEAEGGLTYTFLPPNSNNDWGHSIFLTNVEIVKFFRIVIGEIVIGASYDLRLNATSEREDPSVTFEARRYSDMKTEIRPFLALKRKSVQFKLGPILGRIKTTASQNYAYRTYNAYNLPTGIFVSALWTFKNL